MHAVFSKFGLGGNNTPITTRVRPTPVKGNRKEERKSCFCFNWQNYSESLWHSAADCCFNFNPRGWIEEMLLRLLLQDFSALPSLQHPQRLLLIRTRSHDCWNMIVWIAFWDRQRLARFRMECKYSAPLRSDQPTSLRLVVDKGFLLLRKAETFLPTD